MSRSTTAAPSAEDRVLDVSKGAAKKLDMIDDGTAPVTIEVDPDKQPTEKVREKVEDLAEKKNTKGHTGQTPRSQESYRQGPE